MARIVTKMSGAEVEELNGEMRSEQYSRICENGKALFLQKNRFYHEAFRRMGLMGTITDINGIASKLQNMLYRFMFTGEIDLVKMRSVLQDLHNYAIIGIMNVEDRNLLGIEWSQETQAMLGSVAGIYGFNQDAEDTLEISDADQD